MPPGSSPRCTFRTRRAHKGCPDACTASTRNGEERKRAATSYTQAALSPSRDPHRPPHQTQGCPSTWRVLPWLSLRDAVKAESALKPRTCVYGLPSKLARQVFWSFPARQEALPDKHPFGDPSSEAFMNMKARALNTLSIVLLSLLDGVASLRYSLQAADVAKLAVVGLSER